MKDDCPQVLSVSLYTSLDVDRVESALSYYRHLVTLNEYLRPRWHQPFQLADAALAIGISPSRLSHLFLEKTGITFRDWVCYERTKRAAALLNTDKHSISEVAYSVGYRNRRTFERSFRKALGISPTEYRKRCEAQIMSQG